MPRMQSPCEQCGKTMEYYTSAFRKARRWCSRECQIAATHIWTDCPTCSKHFWYHHSLPRKFCSHACSAVVNGRRNLNEQGKSLDVTCDECGKVFRRNEYQVKKTMLHFCSQRCFGINLSKTHKGIPRPEVSKACPARRRQITKTCQQCGRQYMISQVHGEGRLYCCKACQNAAPSPVAGEKNGHWKGGRLPYYGPNWPTQRRNARRRDNYTCQGCGKTEAQLGKQLDVHHIQCFRTYGLEHCLEANSLHNLICYCPTCHIHQRE